jgi:hypothetical protein
MSENKNNVCVENVQNVKTFDGYHPKCRHLTPKICPARFLLYGNGSPNEILSICLTQENREMYPYTHSGKLSKNEMPGSVRQ